jgi:ABC-type enterobactin transport system permease subunit
MERKIAFAVLAIVTIMWAASVVLTFLNSKRVVDPTLSALMTAIVGGVLVYLYTRRNGGKNNE